MYEGVFEGTYAKNILILSESHHGPDHVESTKSVVYDYFNNPQKACYNFFDKIAKSFGYSELNREKREEFWNKVYFGNYIDELCGIGDDRAKIKIWGNKENGRCQYNDDLFKFVNDKEIDVIFCFSRMVYNALPSLAKAKENKFPSIGNGTIKKGSGTVSDKISHCEYLKDVEHGKTTIVLNRNLVVYGMRHPSGRGGYDADNYSEELSKLFKKYLFK